MENIYKYIKLKNVLSYLHIFVFILSFKNVFNFGLCSLLIFLFFKDLMKKKSYEDILLVDIPPL